MARCRFSTRIMPGCMSTKQPFNLMEILNANRWKDASRILGNFETRNDGRIAMRMGDNVDAIMQTTPPESKDVTDCARVYIEFTLMLALD